MPERLAQKPGGKERPPKDRPSASRDRVYLKNDYDVLGISDARELALRGMYDGMLDEIRALDVDGRGMDVATTTTITDDRESILYLERFKRQHKEDGGGNDYDVVRISNARELASRGMYDGMLDDTRARCRWEGDGRHHDDDNYVRSRIDPIP